MKSIGDEEKTIPTTASAETPAEEGMGGVIKKRRGRPPMTEEQKAAARAKRELDKSKIVREVKVDAGTTETERRETIGEVIARKPSASAARYPNTKAQALDPNISEAEAISLDLNYHKELFTLPRVNYDSLEELQGRWFEYLELCQRYKKRPTVAGYGEAIGTSRINLWRWVHGANPKSREIVEFLEQIFSAVNSQLEDLLLTNKINPVSAIFLLKQSGYRDVQDVVVRADTREEKSQEQLEREYLDSIPVVDD